MNEWMIISNFISQPFDVGNVKTKTRMAVLEIWQRCGGFTTTFLFQGDWMCRRKWHSLSVAFYQNINFPLRFSCNGRWQHVKNSTAVSLLSGTRSSSKTWCWHFQHIHSSAKSWSTRLISHQPVFQPVGIDPVLSVHQWFNLGYWKITSVSSMKENPPVNLVFIPKLNYSLSRWGRGRQQMFLNGAHRNWKEGKNQKKKKNCWFSRLQPLLLPSKHCTLRRLIRVHLITPSPSKPTRMNVKFQSRKATKQRKSNA